ncbi:hypothetical protein FQN60_008074 [Etheostoma spectabile]|uniref:Uncharacterized protein n=1 Tax=Etheostoma spectabile TaxID=54343 RepID=A0A5J5CTF3_9PERO|nr:hypothetical protein FQN60_008074 [Etheostoma spectabile]
MFLTEEAINPVGCTTDSLHHNKLHQSGFSLMRLHGDRASTVLKRWRQRWSVRDGGGRRGGGRTEVDGGTRRRGREGIDTFSYFTTGYEGATCRDGVEGGLGCWLLWDQDLQWPLKPLLSGSVGLLWCFLLHGVNNDDSHPRCLNMLLG